MNASEQPFFDDLEKKLWTAANKLLPSLDAAVYKHIVLGLLFIKYVSDAFEERQKELKTQFQDPVHEYHMNPAEYPGTYEEDVAAELEMRDYYTEKMRIVEAVQAQMRTAIRVLLRKYSYPLNVREAVAEQVLALAKQTPAEPA